MIEEILSLTTAKMDRAVESAQIDFQSIRTGRVNPAIFQKMSVDYYGTPTPLEQLASIQNQDARTVVVTPYDKSALKEIEQTIRNTPDLGANPSNDGVLIRVAFPELTEDRRKDLVKVVRTKAEDARINMRNIRRKCKTELEALKTEVGDDEVARGEKELEAMTKHHVDAIDAELKRKEAELLEV